MLAWEFNGELISYHMVFVNVKVLCYVLI